MCQSNAYLVRGDDEELVMEEVVLVQVDGGQVNLRSLFGEPLSVVARIKQIDLVRNRIVLEASD